MFGCRSWLCHNNGAQLLSSVLFQCIIYLMWLVWNETQFKYFASFSQAEIYRWLTSTFFIWFFLALYFDNVIKDVNGVRKSWYYFLVPSYWTGRASSRAGKYSIFYHSYLLYSRLQISYCTHVSAGGNNVLPLEGMPTDEDVLEEERFVKEHTSINDPNIAVKVCGLVKIFPGTRGCCKCKTTPAYHAIKVFQFSIR